MTKRHGKLLSDFLLSGVAIFITFQVALHYFVSVSSDPVHQQGAIRDEDYAIPPRLIFTYRHNLLEKGAENDKDKLVLANVKRTIDIYRERHGTVLEILFLDDDDCLEQIRNLAAEEHAFRSLDPSILISYYQRMQGSVKSDICRGIVLYRQGGYYLDVDIMPFRQPLWDVLPLETDFVTAESAPWPPPPQVGKRILGFFQAVWAVRPYHAATLEYLRRYQERAEARGQQYPGMFALADSYKNISATNEGKTVLKNSILLQEGWLEEGKDLDVPRLEGVGCCCHAVVRFQWTILFYSRAPGTGGAGGVDSCQLPNRSL